MAGFRGKITDTAERLEKRRTFVVDPIDGTRGFLEGRDVWCISIAVVEAGAARRRRARLPGARGDLLGHPRWRRVPQRRGAARARGGNHAGNRRAEADGGRAAQGLRDTLRRIHYIPSLAYRIAMIAGSTLDATFVKPDAHDWDLAAADLILSEAGGAIRNRDLAAPTYGGATTTSWGARCRQRRDARRHVGRHEETRGRFQIVRI